MKLIATLIATLGFSSMAFGSYLERCNFSGDLEVKESFKLGEGKGNADMSGVVLYKINSAVDKGSHSADACERHVGETVIFTIENRVKYFGMTQADVSYFYVNNFGPNGVISSTTYDIINLPAANDAVYVSNLRTRWINMMPGPGRIDRGNGTTTLMFDATVTSTGCTGADNFKAEVVKNEDGEQVLSVRKTQPDLCETTPHPVEVQLEATGFEFSDNHIIYNNQVQDVQVNIAY